MLSVTLWFTVIPAFYNYSGKKKDFSEAFPLRHTVGVSRTNNTKMDLEYCGYWNVSRGRTEPSTAFHKCTLNGSVCS
jgi:hypothetical protein